MSDTPRVSARNTRGVAVQDLRKSYGTNLVLKGVNLTVEAGEIHALLGPNGSGKSTLLGCLSGAVRPDAGTIRIGEVDSHGFTPQTAIAAGTAIIYQHFQLIDDLSVSDNVFLGSELTTKLGLVDRRAQRRRTQELLAVLNVDLSPDAIVGGLSTGQQQIVEIARALRHDPSLLILDEPTAALSSSEIDALMKLVTSLASERGLAIIYVTHLLREVMEIAQTVTMLSDGEVLWSRPVEQLSLDYLVAAMSPDPRSPDAAPRRDLSDHPVLFSVRDLCSDFTGPVDFDIRAGEIVGVFGLLGSGRTSLVETMAGVQRRTRGSMRVADGTSIEPRSPSSAISHGIALVASDRRAQSLLGDMSALENVLIPHYRKLSRPLRPKKRERALFDQLADQVGLRPRRPDLEADRFSGGNAQKLAVGRWLVDKSELSMLILDEPTQGVDRGAREDIYDLLRDFVSGGSCVVFTTSDPEEALAIADRIVILSNGRVVEIVGPDADERQLLGLAHAEDARRALTGTNPTTEGTSP